MNDTTHLDTEHIESESFLEPRRYRVRYQCGRCGKKFTRTFGAVPREDPPCPRRECIAASANENLIAENRRLRAMLDSGQPPAQIGANTQVRAIDTTAEIVMKDYGMTNLQDSVREGEPMAQKLAPPAQAAADNYFGGQKDARVQDFATGRMRTVRARQLEAIGRRAMAGGYRHTAVAPSAVTPDAVRGQPALTMVRTESTGKRA